MGNCERLKWNRRKMRLTQNELAEKAGLSSATIGRLERDETRWEFITDETFDKLSKVFEEIQGMKFRKVHESNSVNLEEKTEEIINMEVVEPKMEETLVEVEENEAVDNDDAKTLVLLEFAFEGLKESETHEDFKANLKLIKRIVDSY